MPKNKLLIVIGVIVGLAMVGMITSNLMGHNAQSEQVSLATATPPPLLLPTPTNSSDQVVVALQDANATQADYAVETQRNRAIIYEGQIWLVIKDTQEAITAVTKMAEELGGYVSNSSVYQTSNNILQGNITIRVPSEHYQETMIELRALALQVQREESRSQDVTEEFTDQEARLANLKAGEDALQNLLEEEQQQGNNIADIATVQQKLAEVRGQIEQTEGRIRYLTDQTSLSTITIELIPETLPPTPTPTSTPLPGWSPSYVAEEASQSLVLSFQRTANAMIWGIIFVPLIIVYLIPVALVIWLGRWGWKRYKIKQEILPAASSAEHN